MNVYFILHINHQKILFILLIFFDNKVKITAIVTMDK
jgi:hypothetical protein